MMTFGRCGHYAWAHAHRLKGVKGLKKFKRGSVGFTVFVSFIWFVGLLCMWINFYFNDFFLYFETT